MRNIIFSAALCLFALKSQANSINLDSLHAGVASATAYTHGTIDSGEAQIIYKWDFLPLFANPTYITGSLVTDSFTISDLLINLPPDFTIYVEVGLMQNADTIWNVQFMQVFVSAAPVSPTLTFTSTVPNLTGAVEPYFYDDGNCDLTATPYISYDGGVNFSPKVPWTLSGTGNGSYVWNNLPPGFTFYRYFRYENCVGIFFTDTISITTLSEPAAPWISFFEVAAPPDSLIVGALVMGNSLTTTVSLSYSSSNGATGTAVYVVSGANQLDTVWLQTNGLGMEEEVQFNLCASNSMGFVCAGEMSVTTDTKAFVVVDSVKGTTWNHGDAYVTIHVPAGFTANTGYILSESESLWPIIDQSDSMTIHYQTENFQINLSEMYDQINYYLYVYGNATNGKIFDTMFMFQFDEAGVSSIENFTTKTSTLWCDGNTVTVHAVRNQRLTVSSVLGIVKEINLSNITTFTLPTGFYTYRFESGESGKFLINH
jgi:hypothetical protein